MKYDVVFWDFDGTLVYSHSLWTRGALDALRQAGGELDYEQLRPFTRNIYPWDVPDPEYRPLQGQAWWDYVEQQFCAAYCRAGIGEDLACRAAAGLRQQILQVGKYHLFDDTIPALQLCRAQGVRNILLSNNYPELEQIVEQLALTPWLDGMVVSGQIGWDKPRPEIFAHGMALAGPGARCLMVGDNPVADIQGAQGAGLDAALVHRLQPSTADYQAETLLGLLEQIEE